MNLNHLNLRVRDTEACRSFYEEHFGFSFAFAADGGSFLRNEAGFLLALVPADPHQALPDGFHIGFGLDAPDDVARVHASLFDAGARVTGMDDFRPDEDYVTFRVRDPDGTEIEVFWES